MKLRLISEGEHKDAFGTHKWKTYAQIPTNADRIRSMTDEELAEFITSPTPQGICKDRCGGDIDYPCSECALEWLKQEADNGNA